MNGWYMNANLIVMSIVFFLLTTGVTIGILVRLPADYFINRVATECQYGRALFTLRNSAGLIVIVFGLILLLPLVPGPGLAIVLLGLSIMNFPGKTKMEIRILKFPKVLHAINAIRKRFGREPFSLPLD